jgi:hypothetical protein
MITYETFCQIKDLHQRQGLNAPQIATALGLHRHTVAKWLAEPHYQPRRSAPPAQQIGSVQSRYRALAGQPSLERGADLPTPARAGL